MVWSVLDRSGYCDGLDMLKLGMLPHFVHEKCLQFSLGFLRFYDHCWILLVLFRSAFVDASQARRTRLASPLARSPPPRPPSEDMSSLAETSKAGVTFLDLVAADKVQGGLFDRQDDARSASRMSAVDQLNARFGRGAVGFGVAGERQGRGLRWEFISPRYTTMWDELLRV
jgi:hypothetical protein